MLSQLFKMIGFAWSVRAMTLLVFVLQAISIPFIRERLPPPKNSSIIDWTAFSDLKFMLHCLSGFFSSFGTSRAKLVTGVPLLSIKLEAYPHATGLYTPFWYIELFMLSHGSNMNLAFYSIAIMNAAGIVGRIGNGYVADRVSITNFFTSNCSGRRQLAGN